MAHAEEKISWTHEAVRAHLLQGLSPRDTGGEDARANRPFPLGYLPASLREVHTRAELLCQRASEEAEDDFAELAANVRSNPFAIEPEIQRARAIPDTVADEIDGHIESETAEYVAAGAEKTAADVMHRRNLQAADAAEPPGGWSPSFDFWLLFIAIGLIESGLSAAWLWHALGAVRALMTGSALSLISLGGGYFCAVALLRPVRHQDMTARHRFWQWVAASVIVVISLALMYIGACYREVWIAGQDGNQGEMIAAFQSPGEVLVNFDVVVLAALGVAGFCAAAIKAYKYFHGFRSLLRESGLARIKAAEMHKAMADDLREFATTSGNEGNAGLDRIQAASAEWIREITHCGEDASRVALDSNRNVDLVRRVFDEIVAQYADGFAEVRSGERGEISYALNGVEIEVPDLFPKARQAAIEAAGNVSDTIQQARRKIGAIVTAGIQRIDILGGFRPGPGGAGPVLIGR